MTAVVSATLATALLVGSCGANADGAFVRVGEPGPDHVEGRVRLVGARPFARTLIETADSASFTVVGPYAAEVGRLAGADVRVTGSVAAGEPTGPTIEATSYEILSVDGDAATVGTLGSDEDGYYLESRGRTVRLADVSDGLAAAAGSLVWVVIDERGGVARYGVLRGPVEPGASP